MGRSNKSFMENQSFSHGCVQSYSYGVYNVFTWFMDADGVYMARFVDHEVWLRFLVSVYTHRLKIKPQD